MKYEDLRQIREEFHDWCLLLSLDEIAKNDALIVAMKRLEHSLVEAVCTPQAFFIGQQS